MNRNEYNGWTNYETWLVKLWLDNDEPSYITATSLPKLYSVETGSLAAQLKELVEDLTLGDEPPASLATDLIRGALAVVNWQEIAKHCAEEVQEDAQ